MYTKVEEAIHFVFKAMKGKRRIKEDIELAFHSISVGAMLEEIHMDEEYVLAGLLHDIVEDTDYDIDYIKEHYGNDVAYDVLYLSEDKSIKDFKERKIEFIERLSSCEDDNIIICEIADKLQNLLSDYELFKKNGKESLATLRTTYDMNKWYYSEMKQLFNSRINNNNLLDRYNEIVRLYFDI